MKERAASGSLSFFDIQKSFNSYWAPFDVKDGYYYVNGERIKAGGWKQFKRWEWFWNDRVDPKTGEFPKTSAFQQFRNFEEEHPSIKSTEGSVTGNWTSIGPSSTTGGYAGLGRLNCVAFSSVSNDIIYAGAASGGIWKTLNGGTSWTPMSDNTGALGISDIIVVQGVMDDILYVATGDRDHGDNYSVGVLKSFDGGNTWNKTGLDWSQSSLKIINRLLVDPANDDVLYAATSDGLFTTSNGGNSWTNLTSEQFINIKFKPGNTQVIYGSTRYGGQIYRSTDAGASWSRILYTGGERVEIDVTPAKPELIYALVGSMESGLFGVYKSTDGGDSFSEMAGSSPNMLAWSCDGSDSGGQAWYDLCIAADPDDADLVFIGGVNTWKSTNGGSNWMISNHWADICGGIATTVHADKHYFAYQPITKTFFECNDGGLYKTSNAGTNWTNIGSGLVISQIYRLGVSQTNPGDVICGLQDCGTKALLSNLWNDVIGGDGMECLIDYTNTNVQYGELYFGNIYRTDNRWESSTRISAGLSGNAGWITPYVIDPGNSSTLYCGYQDVWRTTSKGSDWLKISSWNGSTLQSLAVAPSASGTIYAATSNTLYRTTDGGSVWTNITGILPVGSSNITYLSVKQDDPNTVWVSMGQFNEYGVFQSADGGGVWTDISNGLPSIPVNCVIQNKQNTSKVELYAGTDIGVYIKLGSAAWVPWFNGLPNVVVTELEIYYDSNPALTKIRAATYGRGLWESDVFPSVVGNPPQNLTATAGSTQVLLEWDAPAGELTPNQYKIFRSTSENGSYSPVNTAVVRTCTDTGLTNGATYWYFVTAVYESPDGESYPSNKASAVPVSPDDPGSFTGTPIGQSQIRLSWVKNGNNNPVMIAFNTIPVFGSPQNGTVYTAGNALSGGGSVIYNGPLTLYTHGGLAANTTYYFKAWSVLTGNTYSPGLIIHATTFPRSVAMGDSLALAALYNQCNGSNWTKKSNWMTGPVVSWQGVTVQNDRVVGLNLGDLDASVGLVGPIPAELSNLTGIRELRLANNQLTGSLPDSWATFLNLEVLDLGRNQLSGSLPGSWSALIKLQFIDLFVNQLSGTLPESWSSLVNLNTLWLSGNQLTGTLPDSWSTFVHLWQFSLEVNQLTGSVPASWTALVNLSTFYIDNNQISGLPDLSPLINLSNLYVQSNMLDFGDIEPNIGVSKSEFVYSPQAPVGTAATVYKYAGEEFCLSVPVGGNSNQYQWYKDGILISDATAAGYVISAVNSGDIGTYICQITNTVATDLTLTSEPVTLALAAPGITCAFAIEAVAGRNWAPSQNTWFKYTADHFQYAQITSCDPDNTDVSGAYSYDTWLYVYGNCDGALLDSNDDMQDACVYNGVSSSVLLTMRAGETIYISWPLAFPDALHSQDGFYFSINVTFPQDGDVCETAIHLTLPVINLMGTTSGFIDDYNQSPCSPSPNYMDGNDVVYTIDLPEPGTLSVSIAGAYASVHILGNCPNQIHDASDCKGFTGGPNGGSFSRSFLPGHYYVIISSWAPPQAVDYTLNLSFTNARISKQFSAGWTWFSLNIENTDMSPGKVLSSLTLTEGDYIKNQTVSSTYYAGYGWFGELTTIDPREMYKIKLGVAGSLIFDGSTINPLSLPITIKPGWNWIGYLPKVAKSVTEALTSINPVSDDYIKNQTASSTYYDGFGWFGELLNLEPLDGYMLKTGNAGMLTYPGGEMLKTLREKTLRRKTLRKKTEDFKTEDRRL